jgi:hypothetical protein
MFWRMDVLEDDTDVPLLCMYSLVYAFQSSGEGDDGTVVDQDDEYVYFQPRALRHLLLIDEMESLCPLTNVVVCCPQHTDNERVGHIAC